MKYFLAFIISLLHVVCHGQITITSSNMPSSGDTIRYSLANISSIGNYTATGTNYTWSFGGLEPINQTVRSYKSAFSTPYGFFFFPPKYGEKIQDTVPIPSIPGVGIVSITDIYNFYKKTSSLYATEGLGVKLSGIPVPNFYSDEDELYAFPLNYNDKDSTTFKFSTTASTLVPFVYKKQGYRITQADGWGSITTPYGTANCLRVVTTQYSQDSLKGSFAVGGFTLPVNAGFPNNQRSYQWLTTTEKIPYLEVIGTLAGSAFTPTQIRYRDIARIIVLGVKEETTKLSVTVFPNPATNQLSIITNQLSDMITMKITDIQGKEVLTKTLTDNSNIVNLHQIDITGLPKGIYTLQLSSLNKQETLKISIQ
jgi:hypothetical protein